MGRNNISGRAYNGRVILYAVMAVFCVLALIEIIYGQLQTQAQQEPAVVQDNSNVQLVQELKNDVAEPETNNTGIENAGTETGDNAQLPDIPLQGMLEDAEDADENGTEDGEVATDNTENQTQKHDMQIVFLGDSILDHVREYDGVAYLISQACNADVYNMSIGGTTAALLGDENYSYDEWTSCSLLGVVRAILGDIDGEFLAPYRAGEILKECDFSKTDYFVIEYGVNDFLAKIPDSQYDNDGELRNIDAVHTYVGALELAIGALHDAFPTAKILLISPHYCQFFSGDTFVGDSYSLDYGYGPMIDYSELCGYVYNNNKDKNVIYYNTILDSGIDAYSADDYLEDGIHLTAAGRRAYAEVAARLINTDFRRIE